MLFVQSRFPRVRWVATTGSGRATVQHSPLREVVKYVHHILGNNRIETWKAKSLAKSRGKEETKMAAFSSSLLWMGQKTWFSILFLLWETTLWMAQEGLLTLSVSILDNAYKGQCLSSPTLILHPITFITSWVSAGLLSGLFLLYSISHTAASYFFLIHIL